MIGALVEDATDSRGEWHVCGQMLAEHFLARIDVGTCKFLTSQRHADVAGLDFDEA
jgi:hypothetical protein